jgi:hypothetical protein
MGVVIEVETLSPQPKRSIFGVELCIGGFAQRHQQCTIPLQHVVNTPLQCVKGIGFAVVPHPTGVITIELIAAAVQSVTAFFAPVGFDFEHATNNEPHQVAWNELFTSATAELTNVRR